MGIEIGTRVRDCLSGCEMTHAQAAAKAGITPSQLSKSLAGVRHFSAVELADLANVLGVSLHWLVTGREDPAGYRVAARHRFDAETGRYLTLGTETDRQVLDDIALLYRQAYR